MKKALHLILYLVIILALTSRTAMYFQSRDLFIDEANVARNIYEKDYSELAGALDYEQFAPPLFLFITKASTQVFGFTEMALRLFPFLAGIISVFLLVYLIHLLVGKKYAIYPLLLFAAGHLFLHYGTELKQYSGDFMCTLILLVAAIRTEKCGNVKRFSLLWIVLGSIAVWFSMPSVFILFGVGFYWLLLYFLQKDYKDLALKLGVIATWLIQFGLYFFFILKDQIGSDYLQNYHANSFLYFPYKLSSIIHDVKVLSGVVGQAGGFTIIALVSNTLLILIGSFALYKTERLRSLLFFVPILVLILVALLKQYALVDRLILFIHPIIFVLLAYGVYFLFQFNNKIVHATIVIVLAVNVFNHQHFNFIWERFEIQEIHYALDKLVSKQLLKNNDPVWVHNAAVPAFTYYTSMSTKQSKYGTLKNQAQLLQWDADYRQLLSQLESGDRVWILLTNAFQSDKDRVYGEMEQATLISTLEKPGCLLLQFEKK